MAEKEQPAAQPVKPSVPIQELLANAGALFSCGPEVLEGALYGSNKTELTVDEAQTLIDGFLRKKVQ
ncbi:hypothetical protein [Paenibacillus sp. P32E]|uniref:hypothetical protein n=1 Tax=Paenibacillus sp. P32E TaxID=1349434 RepID=UPI000964B81A|nr:hypothetical protein [Paenibacillus sp. P32E]OKP91326.1 hypothetical protein A3848_09465 [Paenibacillus sp. P32E]